MTRAPKDSLEATSCLRSPACVQQGGDTALKSLCPSTLGLPRASCSRPRQGPTVPAYTSEVDSSQRLALCHPPSEHEPSPGDTVLSSVLCVTLNWLQFWKKRFTFFKWVNIRKASLILIKEPKQQQKMIWFQTGLFKHHLFTRAGLLSLCSGDNGQALGCEGAAFYIKLNHQLSCFH